MHWTSLWPTLLSGCRFCVTTEGRHAKYAACRSLLSTPRDFIGTAAHSGCGSMRN
ncbi:hypothetical protein EFD56_10770 [Rhizobium phaseoli]|nr:hypothetical protein EFD56_10770 [Rhizobium phaseoli]